MRCYRNGQQAASKHPTAFVCHNAAEVCCQLEAIASSRISYFSHFLFSTCIFGTLSQECFSNLILLVVAIERLLTREVLESELADIQATITDFLKDAEKIYSEKILISCFHELLHLPECTLNFGHLNSVNSFPFEENNRKIIGFIKGRDLIGDEFFKIFSIYQELNIKASEVECESIRECLKNINIVRFCNFKRKKMFKIFQIDKCSIPQVHLNLFKKYFGVFKELS